MSKAFTSEEADDPTVPGRRPEIAREPRPITAAGRAGLVERLAKAEERLRLHPDDPEWLQVRALVDAALASVVVTAPRNDGRAGFGCRVTFEPAPGMRRTFTLVGPDEADPARGRVSVGSPVARALLGAAPGDEVEFGTDGRTATWTVLEVVPGSP